MRRVRQDKREYKWRVVERERLEAWEMWRLHTSDDMSQLHVRSRRRLVPACIPDEQFGATLYIVRKSIEGRDSPSSTEAVLMGSCG